MEKGILDAGQLSGDIQKLFGPNNLETSIFGTGKDAAMIHPAGQSNVIISNTLLLEGIDFDLVYFPLRYLGFKTISVGVADIVSMGGSPSHIRMSLGLSKRFQKADILTLMMGIKDACEYYGIDMMGVSVASSLTGLTLSSTTIGMANANEEIPQQAQKNDLICVTGDIGAAYMGLQLLVREKVAFSGTTDFAPDFSGREYLLQRQLKPIARLDILSALRQVGVRPTSIKTLKKGLATDLLDLLDSSEVGCRIYEQRLPIDYQTAAMAQDFGLHPTVTAMNGGDDYELLFTVPLGCKDLIDAQKEIHQIGFVTEKEDGCRLVSGGGNETDLERPTFLT